MSCIMYIVSLGPLLPALPSLCPRRGRGPMPTSLLSQRLAAATPSQGRPQLEESQEFRGLISPSSISQRTRPPAAPESTSWLRGPGNVYGAPTWEG